MPSEVVERVAVPGAALWTASQGAGLPVILCHGGPGLCDNLGTVAEMIEDLALVHRYDQRGSGRSPSDGPFDVETFIADLEALRQHWGHEGWIVGGHSWGANLALAYAVAYPERTLGVIYLSGSGLRRESRAQVRQARATRLTEHERAELTRLQPRLRDGDSAITARFLHLVWLTDFADRRVASRVLAQQDLYQFARNDQVARAITSSFDALVANGFEDRLQAMTAPILVVHGAHDVPSRAQRVADAAPNAQWALLEDSAHIPWLEQPAAFRALVRKFVAEVGAGEGN